MFFFHFAFLGQTVLHILTVPPEKGANDKPSTGTVHHSIWFPTTYILYYMYIQCLYLFKRSVYVSDLLRFCAALMWLFSILSAPRQFFTSQAQHFKATRTDGADNHWQEG